MSSRDSDPKAAKGGVSSNIFLIIAVAVATAIAVHVLRGGNGSSKPPQATVEDDLYSGKVAHMDDTYGDNVDGTYGFSEH